MLEHHLKGQGLVLQGHVLDPEILSFLLVLWTHWERRVQPSLLFFGFCFNYQMPGPGEKPQAPPAHGPGKAPTPGAVLDFRGHRLRRPVPSPPLSLSDPVPNTNDQGLGGQPRILKGPAGARCETHQAAGPSYESCKQKPSPLNTGTIGIIGASARLSRCSARPETLRSGSQMYFYETQLW